jgi:hypothetical protein
MKIRLCWVLALPVAILFSSCGAPTSISTSFSCSGYMLVEGSSIQKRASKIRENKIKHKDKSYKKSHRGN